MPKLPANIGFLAAYVTGIATVLVLQSLQPQPQVVVVPPTASILANPPTVAGQQQASQAMPLQPVVPAEVGTEIQPVSPPEQAPVQQTVTVQTCTKNEDCPSPTAVCNAYRLCEELASPSCSCSQPMVLQCADASQRAKHTFCEQGCRITPQGARCL